MNKSQASFKHLLYFTHPPQAGLHLKEIQLVVLHDIRNGMEQLMVLFLRYHLAMSLPVTDLTDSIPQMTEIVQGHFIHTEA